MPIPFLAYEISGLAQPTYNSGAVNRKLLMDISGALDSRIDGLEGDAGVTWSEITTGGGISPETFGVSGTGIGNLEVLGYDTISSQAKKGFTSGAAMGDIAYLDEIDISEHTNLAVGDGVTLTGDTISWASGTQLHNAWVSTQALQDLAFKNTIDISDDTNLAAGDGITLTGDTISWASGTQLHNAWVSTQALGDLSFKDTIDISDDTNLAAGDGITLTGDTISWASGAQLHKAYLSAQALEGGAFKRVNSGWALVADEDTIAHGLSAKPNHVTLTPSGSVTFATAFTCDATNITVRLSCAGSRMLNWRAEV